MKQIACMLLVIIIAIHVLLIHATHDDFQIIIKPEWTDLECGNSQNCKFFGGKWILAGSITFKKWAKEPVNLCTLALHWNGKNIEKLTGSLYKKTVDKPFLPIEDNLICDGTWYKKDQILSLKFDENQSLGFVNTYYLVLTIPEELEPIIKNGTFKIDNKKLPEAFQCCKDKNALQLSLNALDACIESLS